MKNRKKNILIVVNPQNDFIRSNEAKKIIPEIESVIKNWTGYIIATVNTHNMPDYNFSLEHETYLSHCLSGTKGWKINDAIEESLLEHGAYIGYFETPTYGDSFLPDTIVKELQIESGDGPLLTFTLVGLHTDTAIISNALILRASFPESRINIYENCCAGTTKEAHDAVIKILKSCQIGVLTF